MTWLRSKNCVVTGSKAQCAHHIRLGTNGGSGLKPSDYFCIPLENEYHTHGSLAVHKIGEESFLSRFKLDKEKLFIGYMTDYLKENYQIVLETKGLESLVAITLLIDEIERRRPARKVTKSNKTKKVKKSAEESIKAPKASESEFYQKAKELKRVRDKELRDSMKSQRPKVKAKVSTPKKASVTQDPYYQKAKELKKAQDKAMREKLKAQAKNDSHSSANLEYYEKIKQEQKLKAREYRKAQYKKLKQLKSEQK